MANKPVNVTVDATTSSGVRSVRIIVEPDPVKLTETDTGIEWSIVKSPPEWRFTTDDNTGESTGIRIKSPRGRFADDGGDRTTDRKHTWTRDMGRRDQRTYRYTVSVTHAITGETITWDPSIMNN